MQDKKQQQGTASSNPGRSRRKSRQWYKVPKKGSKCKRVAGADTGVPRTHNVGEEVGLGHLCTHAATISSFVSNFGKPVAINGIFNYSHTATLDDGTLQVKCADEHGRRYVRSSSKDGWVTWYRPSGAKEIESFQGVDGKLWFTWHYVGEPDKERGIMKVYHDGDGVHPSGMVEWYQGERGSEHMYFKYVPEDNSRGKLQFS